MISGNNAHPPIKEIFIPEVKNIKRLIKKNHSKTQEGISKDIPITNICYFLEGCLSHNFKTQNCQT